MEVSINLRKRFCKDNNISMQLFEDPYFSERLELFGQKDNYESFIKMIEEDFGGDEEKYFAYYNNVKDDVINYIKRSNAFILLNSFDMNRFAVASEYSQNDVYKESCIGKTFISIDISKANFSSLVLFAKMFNTTFFAEDTNDCFNYNSFMNQFTLNPHIVNSKYIRQVVFGNCNPKRQVTFEKYISNIILNILMSSCGIKKEEVVSLAHDEIILCVDEMSNDKLYLIKVMVNYLSNSMIPLHFEYFKLGRVVGTSAYIKKVFDSFDEDDNSFHMVIKAANAYDLPFIHRALNNESYTENDFVFIQDGKLAKFMQAPKIEIVF